MKTISIGRNQENDIVYDEPSISGSHAEIVICDDGSMTLTDHSTNGTYINGRLLSHASVQVGYYDVVMFPGGIQLDWGLVAGFCQGQQARQINDPSPRYEYHDEQQPSATSYGSSCATLSITQAFNDGFAMGVKNMFSYAGAFFLYILTIWIPYINLGTTYAMLTLPARYKKDEAFNPLSIFESRFRKPLVNLLLTHFFMFIVMLICIPLVFPAAVVFCVALSFSLYFVIDDDMTPLEAMQTSNKCTYGNKWRIFGVTFLFALAVLIIGGIITMLFNVIFGVDWSSGSLYDNIGKSIAVWVIEAIFGFIWWIFTHSVSIGIQASIWNQLKGNVNHD